MASSADHEGYSSGSQDAATTVVVAGAGPAGLMLAYVMLSRNKKAVLTFVAAAILRDLELMS